MTCTCLVAFSQIVNTCLPKSSLESVFMPRRSFIFTKGSLTSVSSYFFKPVSQSCAERTSRCFGGAHVL